jgi:hypothetical protein
MSTKRIRVDVPLSSAMTVSPSMIRVMVQVDDTASEVLHVTVDSAGGYGTIGCIQRTNTQIERDRSIDTRI